MWTVVFIARGVTEAERLKAILSDEGLLVKLRALGEAVSDGQTAVELCVPAGEVRDATEIINAL